MAGRDRPGSAITSAVAETPEERVARLEAELAQAKAEALQKELAEARDKELAEARAEAAGPPAPTERQPQPEVERPAEPVRFGPVQFGKRSGPDTNLATVPRAVPASYRLVAIPFSWWTLFALFLIAVTPIAVWIFVPVAAVITGAVTFVAVAFLSLQRSLRRLTLLKWGEVANIVRPDVLSTGTYFGGTTVQNMRMAQAHGWTVERRWYSGPVTKTRVHYELRGTQASLVVRGLPYDSGVILADSRDPWLALCVSSFPYDLERDPSGNWTGRVSPRAKLGSMVMIGLLLTWTAAMVVLGGLGAGLF